MHFINPITLLTLTIPAPITSLVIPSFYTPTPPSPTATTTTATTTTNTTTNTTSHPDIPTTSHLKYPKRNNITPSSIIDAIHRARPPETPAAADVDASNSNPLITSRPSRPEPVHVKPTYTSGAGLLDGFDIDPVELERVKSGGKGGTSTDNGGVSVPVVPVVPEKTAGFGGKEFEKNVIRL